MLSCLLAYGNSFANSDLDYKHYSNLIYNLLCAIPNLLTFMGKWRESEVPNNRLRDAYLLPIFFIHLLQKASPIHWWCKLPYNLNYSRVRFPATPILNIFSWNFYGLVLRLVKLIDAKGIDVAHFIWGIILFCTVYGFLEKRLFELICTRLLLRLYGNLHHQWTGFSEQMYKKNR